MPTKPTKRTATSRPLSSRQRRFAESVAAGMSSVDACRAAGYTAKPAGASVRAHWRLKDPRIANLITELQAKHAERAAVTVDGQYAKLEEVRRNAIEDRQHGAAVAAIVAQNKLYGLIVDKAQVETIVRRPAPAPDVAPGVILSEDDWQRRLSRH